MFLLVLLGYQEHPSFVLINDLPSSFSCNTYGIYFQYDLLLAFDHSLSCHQLFELPFLYLNNELDLFVHVNVWFICAGIALPKPGCLPMLDIIHLCAIEIMLFLQSVFFPRQYAPFLLLMITCLFLYSTPHSYCYTQCNLPIATPLNCDNLRIMTQSFGPNFFAI